jgi:mannose-6-phosphate isomerase-like protein (cupin superfamily)
MPQTMHAITITEAIRELTSAKTDYARLIENNDFDIGVYRPAKTDPQQPHTRDELYVVAAGSGEFVCQGETKNFGPGDLLFVPAGVEHRFGSFKDDFATWVVFFGKRPDSK